jgi:hypothetical protein
LVFGSGSSSAEPDSVSSPEGGSSSTGFRGSFGVDGEVFFVDFGEDDVIELFDFGDFVDLGGEEIVADATSSSSESFTTSLLFFFAGSDDLPFLSKIVNSFCNCSTLRFHVLFYLWFNRYITSFIVIGTRYN